MKETLKKHYGIVIAVLLVVLAGAAFGIYSYINRPCRADEAYAMAMLGQPQVRLAVGDTYAPPVQLTPLSKRLEKRAAADFETAEITWRTDDPAVATVNADGIVTAVYTGVTTITAEMESLSASVQVEVYVPLEGVSLLPETVSVNIDHPFTYRFDLEPWDAVPPSNVLYTVLDANVGTIDNTGLFIPNRPGTTVVRLIADDFTDTSTVTVLARLLGIALNETEKTIIGGETLQLAVTYTPDYTTDSREVTWTSSDEAVVTVDETGLVTAVGPGHATVSAQCGFYTETCELEVIIPMTGIHFSFQQLEMRNGDSIQIPVGYEPGNTTDDRTLTWVSSNPGVVTVNEEGVVTAVGPGSASVTATCGEFTAKADFTVVIPVTGVAISQGEMNLNVGQYGQLAASCVPANTTESPYITWSSDNPAVATVNEGGVVFGVGPGTCTITANHDMVGATCVVHVFQPLTGIAVTPESLTIVETTTARLGVTFLPQDTTDDKSVTWSSSDPGVASVDGNGVVTGVSEGSCVITATSNARGFAASTAVTVMPFVEVDSVAISETEHTLTAQGEQFALTASYEPADATIGGISWTTSDASVVTVDASGVVTAVWSGTATVTARAGSQAASCTVTVALPEKPKIVVLDPGHGDGFPGACYGGVREEIINLVTANACKQYLEENYYGVQVYMTRTGGTPPVPGNIKADLEQRAQIAQDYGADILVSIHYNASVRHVASGCVAYVSFQPNVADQCNRLANCILPYIAAEFGMTNHGPKSTRSDTYFDEFGNPMDYYAINRHAANRGIPGIIVEHCFMDTQTALIQNNDNLVRFGICDAKGIADYLGLQHK